MMRRALLLSSTAFLLSGLVAGAANTALPDTVHGFDDLPPGSVTTQLENRGGPGQGVVFGNPLGYGFTETVGAVGQGQVSRFVCRTVPTVAASDRARSGRQIARIGCGTEFGAYGAFGVLPRWRTKLTVYVQAFTPGFRPGTFVLTAYDYRRNPIATRTTETSAGPTGWQPLTIVTGSPSIAYFAVYLNRIEPGGLIVGIDDLTYDQPSVPPDPQISFSRADGTSDVIVHQGETASVDFRVTRWNGSVGNVALTTDALNPEIDAASFSPNPAGGTVTKLFLHARVNPDPSVDRVPSTSIATATPLSASSGTTADSHSFRLDVLPVFSFRPLTQPPRKPNETAAEKAAADKQEAEIERNGGLPAGLDLPTCVRTTIPAGLSVAPGFREPITLRASVALRSGGRSGVDATLDPVTYTSGFSKLPEVKLYAPTNEPLEETVLTLTASSPGYPSRRGQIRLRRVAPTIEDVFTDVPNSAAFVKKLQTEEFLKPPQRVTIRGTGFCSGTLVEFGNRLARATPDSISDDGRRIRVPVHRLATDGRITLVLPTGERIKAPRLVDVETYRSRDGFQFVNAAGRAIGWDEFVELFGYDQTHFAVDACPFVPFVKCEVTTPVPSPLAVAFFYNIRSAPEGLCFGMSVASLRLRHRVRPLSGFGRPGAEKIAELDYLSGPSPELSRYIHQMHILQHSMEVQKSREVSKIDSQAQLHDLLVEQLRRQEPVIVGFREWGRKGHAIVAYDIRERGSDFDVIGYNPNQPYSFFEDGIRDGSGAAHEAAETNSTLYVRGERWSFPELGWSGSVRLAYVIPYSAIPFQPRLPETFLDWAFSATGAGGVDQVTNDAGEDLFRPNRPDNLAAFPGASVLPPLDSREGPNPTVLLPTGRTYTVTIRGRRAGPYSAGFFNAGLSAVVQGNSAKSRSSRLLTLGGRSGALTFRAAQGSERVAVTLIAKASDGSSRTVTLRTTSLASGSDTVAFDRARGVVTVKHEGPPTSVSLDLGSSSTRALPTVFTTPMLQIGPGDTLALTPASWRTVGRSAVTLTRTSASGSRATRTLRSAARPAVAISAMRLKQRVSARRATVSLAARIAGPSRRDALATVTFFLTRGGRVVARSTLSVSGPRLARPVVWRTKRLQPGRYTVVGVLTLLSGRNGAVALSGVSRSKRIALTIR